MCTHYETLFTLSVFVRITHRLFVLDLVKRNVPFDEAIMNLPANATDFLDVFIGLYTRVGEDR